MNWAIKSQVDGLKVCIEAMTFSGCRTWCGIGANSSSQDFLRLTHEIGAVMVAPLQRDDIDAFGIRKAFNPVAAARSGAGKRDGFARVSPEFHLL